MIHPARRQLEELCEGSLHDEAVAAHVSGCEFCREICDQLKLRAELTPEAAAMINREDIELLSRRIWLAATNRKAIDLVLMSRREDREHGLLAADSADQDLPDVLSVATLYSEEPEVVMRLMRDRRTGEDYLQLIADAPELIAHVLVRAPEASREFVTDDEGRAPIGPSGDSSPWKWRWEIRLPEAVFELAPLIHDPQKVEYSAESILETAKHDRVRIRFEGLADSKQVSVELLALDGNPDFLPVRILLIQGGSTQSHNARSNQRVLFAIEEPVKRIDLRIFQ